MATTSPNAHEQRSDRQSPDAVPAFSVRFSAGEIASYLASTVPQRNAARRRH